jgi:anti-sigma regulatory factor (Ser/Thr protein kinase)
MQTTGVSPWPTPNCQQVEQVVFPAEPQQCSAARRWARAYFCQRDLAELGDAAALAVSETFTNALRCPMKDPDGHPVIPIRIVQLPSAFRIEIYDGDPTPPPEAVPIPAASDERHRGLIVVDALATRRGSFPAGSGKAVWFTLARGLCK